MYFGSCNKNQPTIKTTFCLSLTVEWSYMLIVTRKGH